MSAKLEIHCPSCGDDTLLKREPVYEGFQKTGETLSCSGCGHVFTNEDEVPFKVQEKSSLFGEDDLNATPDIFAEDEKGRNCRYCKHYVVNPFTQRCGLHGRTVEATDTCEDFQSAPR